jgi:hypothetical protein
MALPMATGDYTSYLRIGLLSEHAGQQEQQGDERQEGY